MYKMIITIFEMIKIKSGIQHILLRNFYIGNIIFITFKAHEFTKNKTI